MKENGAENALMSGSGPTVFGIFTDRETARAACRKLKTSGLARQVFLTGLLETEVTEMAKMTWPVL